MKPFTEDGKKTLVFNRLMKKVSAEKIKRRIEFNQNKSKKKENKK